MVVVRKVLDNGLKIVIDSDPHWKSVATHFYFKTGKYYDPKGYAGLNHYLEHLLIENPTNKYPKRGQAANILKSKGITVYAGVSDKTSTYKTHSTTKNFDLCLDTLTELTQNTIFSQESFEKEKNIILQEINQRTSKKGRVAIYQLKKMMYGDSRSEDETKESSNNITLTDVKEYYDEFYAPNNMVISIVGNINPDETIEKIKKLITKPKKHIPEQKFDFSTKKGMKKIITTPETNALIKIGYPLRGYQDKSEVMQIIQLHFGGHLSDLEQELRNKKKLIYSLSTAEFSGKNSGEIIFTTRCKPDNIDEVINIIKNRIELITNEGISKERIANIIEVIKERNATKIDDNVTKLAFKRGRRFLEDLPSYEEFEKRLETVTPEDVKEIAKKYLTEDKMFVIIMDDSK